MIVLIFMKWSINWEYRMHTATCYDGWTPQNERCDSTSTTADMCPLDYGGTGDGCQPPNLITTLINIALAPGSADEPMFKGQAGVQARDQRTFASFDCWLAFDCFFFMGLGLVGLVCLFCVA